jgi:hypothetical protein
VLPLDREIVGSAQRWVDRVDSRIMRHRQEAAVAAEEALKHSGRAGWAIGWTLAAQGAPSIVLLMTGSFWAVLPYIFLVPAIWLWRRSDRRAIEASARSHHHRGVAEGMAEAVAQLLARGVS